MSRKIPLLSPIGLIRLAAPMVSALIPELAARWLLRLFITPQRRGMVPREENWMQGATRSTLPFDDVSELPVWTWGDDLPTDSPVILLVHGWSGRGSQLGVYAAPLVEAGYRVVTWDMPGHGDFARHADGIISGLPYFAPAIEKVAASVGPVHGIIAHSLGTAGVWYSLSRGLKAERLVFLAPPEDLADYLFRLGLFLKFPAKTARRALAILEARFGTRLDDVRGKELARDRTEKLLIVHDKTDIDVPLNEAQDLAAAWPGAEMIVTEGLGHNRLVRADEVVEMAVGFMKAKAMRSA